MLHLITLVVLFVTLLYEGINLKIVYLNIEQNSKNAAVASTLLPVGCIRFRFSCFYQKIIIHVINEAHIIFLVVQTGLESRLASVLPQNRFLTKRHYV